MTGQALDRRCGSPAMLRAQSPDNSLGDRPTLSFRGAADGEDSRSSFGFGARFLASSGMTRFRNAFRQTLQPNFAAILLLGAGLLALTSSARAQADYTLQPSPALSSFTIPAALADRLNGQGSRLLHTANGAHDPICDVWWSRSVSITKPAVTAPGVLYGALQPGAFLGLLHFISPDAEDSRDQKLKPGFYTMRYAQFPPDSSETDTSGYQDYLLLSPMAADSQVAKALTLDEAIRLSTIASRTAHPALMSLVPVNPAYKRLPAVVADDVGNCAIQVSLTEDSGARQLELALLVLTPLKEDGSS
jgi:hypothetical protein